MSTKITGSILSSCYTNCNGKTCKNSHLPCSGTYNLSRNNRGRKVNRSQDFLKFNAKYGMSIYRGMTVTSNLQTKASSSSNPSTSSWKKWLIGLLLTVILPAAGHKGGLFIGLKGKIDKAIETVEHVTEVVEEIAEEAEKIVEEVEEKLPGDSKLRETLDSFENLAKRAVNEAKKAEDIVHKVKDVEEEVEDALLKAGKDQPKK